MSVNSKMTALADEVRTLSGATAKLGIDAMTTNVQSANNEVENQTTLLAQAIAALEGKTAAGSPAPVLQNKTVTPATSSQTVTPDSGYDGLARVTVNAMPTATQATPSISVSSAGKITATSTQSAGYVAAGTKSATKQLTVQAAQTITPGTSNKTIASGRYLTGTQTIKGDANLKAANIAAGVSIFGVTGTHSGGTDTSDATATAADIVEGETAYVNGTKLTGTNPYEKTATDTEINSQTTKLAELKTILQGKAAGGSGDGTGMETCTVIVSGEQVYDIYYSTPMIVAYDTVVNGKRTMKVEYYATGSAYDPLPLESFTLENVLCGGHVILKVTYSSGWEVSKGELVSADYSDFNVFCITASAGETAEIHATA